MKKKNALALIISLLCLIASHQFDLPPDKISESLARWAKEKKKTARTAGVNKRKNINEGMSESTNKTNTTHHHEPETLSSNRSDMSSLNSSDDCMEDSECNCADFEHDETCEVCDEVGTINMGMPQTAPYDHVDNTIDNPGNRAVVFSWHAIKDYKSDKHGRWGRSTVGAGNEFQVAVKSVKAANPGLPIFLFTNVPRERIPASTRELITVVEIDLMKEAQLYGELQRTGDVKVGFGTKPQALISGWELGILPPHILFLDVDVIVGEPTAEYSLDSIFEPLKYYDVAGCFEGFSIGPRPTPAVGAGWEINTGVLLVRRRALPLVRAWLEDFRSRQDTYTHFVSGEQQALMVALERNAQYRAYPLPPLYNFRRPAIWSAVGPQAPFIVQSHIYSDTRANVNNYLEVARSAAVVMMEDCLHIMKQVGRATHFLCDMLVG